MFDAILVAIVVIVIVSIPVLLVRWLIVRSYRAFKPESVTDETMDEDNFVKEKQKLKRPRVGGIVGILLLNVLGIAFVIFGALNVIALEPLYFTVILSIFGLTLLLALASAILIARYKRIGLYLGTIYVGLSIIGGLLSVINGITTIAFAGLLLWLLVAYYLYKYLMTEPDKNFFT